ncbi:hypothetical protein [Leifsonia sp. C5G2]|uniref:hypothetical protein n=1 Tax=Leifsonia sp. C5G2 TaxID=2735269 RepID=UPI001585A369|nr:hypothetical protein [Leifsonia sp. C5G2]NUU06182.1 hypothetical protein [Leifsonia sp. C5G2]
MGTVDNSIPRPYLRLPDDDGTYIATTQSGSTYVFDLKHRTVTRTPGPDSHPDMHDGQRTLRSIIQCEVGVSGYWTMQPDDFTVDYYWQLTSPIVSIEEQRF